MDIKFAPISIPTTGAIVIGITEELTLRTETTRQIDKQVSGAITRALGLGKFKGKKGVSHGTVSR